MSDHHSHHPPPTRDQTLVAGHELTDAEGAPILKFLVFLLVTTIIIAALVVPFYGFLESREAREKTARYPLAAGRARPLPPAPRLQTYPFTDLKVLRNEENETLTTYAWVDRSAGTVRIPIDRAMELMAQRGLPYRHGGAPEPGAAAPASGSATTTGSASGQPATTGPAASEGQAKP